MILSDRTIREELAAGRIVIEPLDESCIQPSSVDLHIDRLFRVFRNHTMGYIDVKQDLEDLTELVEIAADDVFILHPGEFVLGSTAERVALPDDLVARLEGKSSLGRLGLLIHSSLPASEPVLVLHEGALRTMAIGDIVRKQLAVAVVGFDKDTFEVAYHPVTGWYEGPADRIFEVRLRSGRHVRVTAGHNLFTIDRDGALATVRAGQLRPGLRVAIPRHIPDPQEAPSQPTISVLDLIPEPDAAWLVCEGPTVTAHFHREGGVPFTVARQEPGLLAALGPHDRLKPRGGRHALPAVLTVDEDLAWFLGLSAAVGSRRRAQFTVAHSDHAVLDRAEAVLRRLDLPVRRTANRIACTSRLASALLGWLGAGSVALGWPEHLIRAFLDGAESHGGSTGDLLLLRARLAPPRSRHTGDRLVDGGLLWDEVVEVVDTGVDEPVYDLEVRPGGRKIENFLAGAGGVFVSNTAGFVDAGWDGHLTLELSNVANLPITLYPGMKIGQISFLRMTTPADAPYGSASVGSKYQGQRGPTPSRYWENFGRPGD